MDHANAHMQCQVLRIFFLISRALNCKYLSAELINLCATRLTSDVHQTRTMYL